MTRPNRATHADPFAGLCQRGSPLGADAAIAAFCAYRADPIMEPRPSLQQIRLVAQYCEEYIWSPLFTSPVDELADLRYRVAYITTLRDLADWLWDCRRIGVEPL